MDIVVPALRRSFRANLFGSLKLLPIGFSLEEIISQEPPSSRRNAERRLLVLLSSGRLRLWVLEAFTRHCLVTSSRSFSSQYSQ